MESSEVNMKRVTGIGGIFVKAKDHEKLHQWYEKHLGIPRVTGSSCGSRQREVSKIK